MQVRDSSLTDAGEGTLDPTITLAGRAWRVPLLAPRQNRIVVPLLIALPMRPEQNYVALLDIAFAALTRAHRVPRDEFEDWPIATYELVEAIHIIARQTGLIKSVIPVPAKAGNTGPRRKNEQPDWDAIIAQFVNFLPGTTPDYWEDALTMPRLEAMNREWRLHPPLAVLAAGWLGYKPKPNNLDAIEELMRFFPTGQLRLN